MTTSALGISFDVRPSAALTRVLGFVVAVGVVAPWATRLPWPACAGLSLAALAVGIWRVARFRTPALAAVQWGSDGVWQAVTPLDEAFVAEPRDARVVGDWVFLRLFWQGGRADLVLGPDNVERETLRVLRLRVGSGR